VKSFLEHDSKRFKSESVALKSMNHFVESCDIQKQQADKARELARQQVEKARELATRTYKVCNRVFGSIHSLNSHNDAVHGYPKCSYCYKELRNKHALNQHRNATGHW